jgi:nitroreductase
MTTPLDDSALDTIFRKARTHNKWFDKPVSREQLAALYDLMRWGPTSATRAHRVRDDAGGEGATNAPGP